jgi:branched-chain amino acid aminotransferase
LIVSEVQRIPPSSVDPTAKNYHWNDLTMGLLGALDAGADTVLLRDARDNVVEGPGFNVFAVIRGALVTPREGVLQGITRLTAIEVGRSHGYAVEERELPLAELLAADEAFITSSGGGVMPVTQVNETTIGDGNPGRITRQIAATYWGWHRLPKYSTPIQY